MSEQGITYAYRKLYKTALQAIHYSTPARYQLRDIIRRSFRYENPLNLNIRRVENTVRFLERAREVNGLEHRILRNILHSCYWRSQFKQNDRKAPWLKGNSAAAAQIRRDLYSHLDITVTMLNETMDLCLRSTPLIEQDLRKRPSIPLVKYKFKEHPIETTTNTTQP